MHAKSTYRDVDTHAGRLGVGSSVLAPGTGTALLMDDGDTLAMLADSGEAFRGEEAGGLLLWRSGEDGTSIIECERFSARLCVGPTALLGPG